ncbi:hypothetical protein [Desulfovibrio sp. ZJ369]|uniref:hypothetical protein n=1 Tax=Desulfovibrio sp. ZJ369 TaxID=2709793 RepID=UPI0013EB5D44|nr:hypothetical protein [Desulfovibrio sp. ZJ369]
MKVTLIEHIAFETLAPALHGESKFLLRLSLLSSSARRHNRQWLTRTAAMASPCLSVQKYHYPYKIRADYL